MIELNEIPQCPCGHVWETNKLEGYTSERTGFHFVLHDFRCPRCERIASRYGYMDTSLNFVVVSKEKRATGFNVKVVEWIKSVLNGVIANLFREGEVNTPPSLTNPDPATVQVYAPDTEGQWVPV